MTPQMQKSAIQELLEYFMDTNKEWSVISHIDWNSSLLKTVDRRISGTRYTMDLIFTEPIGFRERHLVLKVI